MPTMRYEDYIMMAELDFERVAVSSPNGCADMDTLDTLFYPYQFPYIEFQTMVFDNPETPEDETLPGIDCAIQDGKPTCSCADLAARGGCTAFGLRSVRFLCPITCGCSHPTSGLLQQIVQNGCPWACLSQLPAQMAAAPCADGQDIPGAPSFAVAWSRLWGEVQQYQQRMASQASGADVIQLQKEYVEEMMETPDCSRLAAGNPFKLELCDPTSLQSWGFTSLIPYCPVTCGCADGTAADIHGLCPPACTA